MHLLRRRNLFQTSVINVMHVKYFKLFESFETHLKSNQNKKLNYVISGKLRVLK